MAKPHHTPGNKYGRLTIISRGPKHTVFCKCDCGVVTCPAANDLKNGLTKSCGCLHKEIVVANNSIHKTTHSMVRTGTYRSWAAMKARCVCPTHHAAKNYSERGITLCERWMEFENFYADMGKRPDGTTIDRKDNDAGYSKENCRWATKPVQSNNKRTNVILMHQGLSLNVSQWSAKTGLLPVTISWRIAHGWSIDRALTTPSRKKL